MVHKSEDAHWVCSDGTAIGVKNTKITSIHTYFVVCAHKPKSHYEYPGYDFPHTALYEWIITVMELKHISV